MSKTMFVTVIILCVLLFSSCSELGQSTLHYDGDLSYSGELKCGEVIASAEFTRTGDDWTVSFTSPDSISGLVMTGSGENTSVSYDGISFDFPSDGAGFTLPASEITEVIDMLKESAPASKNGEQLYVSGNNERGSYRVTADMSGKLLSVSIGDVMFTVSQDG